MSYLIAFAWPFDRLRVTTHFQMLMTDLSGNATLSLSKGQAKAISKQIKFYEKALIITRHGEAKAEINRMLLVSAILFVYSP